MQAKRERTRERERGKGGHLWKVERKMDDDAAGVCSVMHKWLNECSEPVDESVLQVQVRDQKMLFWFETPS